MSLRGDQQGASRGGVEANNIIATNVVSGFQYNQYIQSEVRTSGGVHTNYVLTVAWSSDSQSIASGGADGIVQVWDAVTREIIGIGTYSRHVGWFYPYANPRPYIYAVAWSPVGQQIASAGTGETMHVWDAFGESIVHMYFHPDPLLRFPSIRALAWSPDGKRIASICSSDVANIGQKVVRVWDMPTGQELVSCPMRTGFSNAALSEASALAWSPDGNYLASGCGNKAIYVWDAATGRQVTTWSIDSGMVLAVAWAPNSKQIAAASARGSKSTVSVWSMDTRAIILTYRGHKKDVRAVAWSPDGNRIASGSHDKTVHVWDSATGGNTRIYRHHASWVTSVAWSPDGNRIASGSHDKTVHVWQV